MNVGIYVCTYNRNEKLVTLINSIFDSVNFFHNQEKCNYIDIPKINIIDNSPTQTAFSVYKRYKSQVNYYHQPQKGITNARNMGIDLALKADNDYLVFLDDDETVSKQWYIALTKKIKKYPSDIICGPVIRLYDEDEKQWIVKSELWERKNYADETILNSCGAGNVSIPVKILKDTKIKFDLDFSLSGGEDTKFFYELHKKGYDVLWCKDAVAYEKLEAKRANVKYLLSYSYRIGFTYTRCYIFLFNNNLISKMKRLLAGIFNVLRGLLLLMPSLICGRIEMIKCLTNIARGLGQIKGLSNKKLTHY